MVFYCQRICCVLNIIRNYTLVSRGLSLRNYVASWTEEHAR